MRYLLAQCYDVGYRPTAASGVMFVTCDPVGARFPTSLARVLVSI